jgi:hypothetical protein
MPCECGSFGQGRGLGVGADRGVPVGVGVGRSRLRAVSAACVQMGADVIDYVPNDHFATRPHCRVML